ncbi:MAG: tetratricopeptide repeat protein [Pyrinomonadaceae bacterium]|nr:tetratricopeptide repeat protein [Sphingobacteriaceae bacterium]
MNRILTIGVFLLLSFLTLEIQAQTLIKEATNSFAKYTRSHDLKDLETARKQIDEAYKTPKDSSFFKNNLTRSLIYSTLAAVDSNRKFEYKIDPARQALTCLHKLDNSKFRSDFIKEIEYIKSQLSKSFLYDARVYLFNYDHSGAVDAFKKVDSLTGKNTSINHNIALLHQRIGNTRQSVEYYQQLIKDSPDADYFLMLSYLYEQMGEEQAALQIAQQGRLKFPENKDLLFYELNYFADNKKFDKVLELVSVALKLDEFNPDLNYLAGFSFESMGEYQRAEEYYERVLNTSPNNYDANYALGLLYLQTYAMKSKKKELLFRAKQYLLIAMEIDPNQLKTLQSLSLLYKYNGDENQLRKINSKINQLKLN